jgi:hypothetical protein
VSLVWLSPARALADELPKDTNQIESLTPDQAKKLAAEFPGVWVVIDPSTTYMRRSLPLNGLNSLDAETATALAAYPEGPLLLDGLTTLDAATAKTLAQLKNEALSLNGLTTLDAATAKTLAEFKGSRLSLNGLTALDADTATALAEFKGQELYFSGLTTLDAATAKMLAAIDKWNGDLFSITAFESPDSVETAAALAKRKGPLTLRNLKKISPKTLAALIEKEDVEIPLIETLELIPEPDGSPAEDFMIPKGFNCGRRHGSRADRTPPSADGERPGGRMRRVVREPDVN